MDDILQQQQIEQQQMIDEQTRWISDPLRRDMMWNDWNSKTSMKSSQRTGIIVLLIFVLLTIGAILTFVHAEQPSTSEIYQRELVRQLHTDSLGNTSDSYKAFVQMDQEMNRLAQQRQERRETWIYILAICALAPLYFIIYMIVTYVNNKEYHPSRREVFIVAGVTIVTAIVLYVVDVFFFYMRFYSERNTRLLFLTLVVFFGLGWIVYQLNKTKKQ